MVAILLGRTCTNIPLSASFDLETLDSIFQLGYSSQMIKQAKIFPDAASVLLTMTRVLIHQDSSYVQQKKALVLIKFLEQLYKTLPQFATFAKKVEFIEALVVTLFAPSLIGVV